jgi:hypothetical protein
MTAAHRSGAIVSRAAYVRRMRAIDRIHCAVQSAPAFPAVYFRVSVAQSRSWFARGAASMFGIGDLFQWERFVTPTIIKVFYWLAVVISVLLGFAGAVSSLATMAFNPFVGMIYLIASFLGACMGVIVSRITAEFVLIVFRINEHLGAIRNQGTGIRGPAANF